ncbi:MAG: LiaI-LiaF-like domain-containing protein [Acetivibrionales bacterium]|jgi:uncharacterized protein involved in response to NO
MKNRNIGLGIFFIAAGAIWLLINTGYLEVSMIFDSLRVLWPLLLVVIGLNIIFGENAVANTLIWLLFIAAVIGYSVYYQSGNTFIQKPVNQRMVVIEKCISAGEHDSIKNQG